MARARTTSRLPWSGARPARRTVIIGLAVSAVAFVLLANLHFLYVAVSSQPDCVPHIKMASGEPGTFRAARPAC